MQSMVPSQLAPSNMSNREIEEIRELAETQILTQSEIEEIIAQGFADMVDDDADGATDIFNTTGEDIDAMAHAYDVEHNPIFRIVR